MFHVHFYEYDMQNMLNVDCNNNRSRNHSTSNSQSSSSGSSSETTAAARRNAAIMLALLIMNVTVCSLLIFVYGNDHFVLTAALLNLSFVALACIGVGASIPYLIVANVIAKTLFGMFLAFLICQILERIIATQENIVMVRGNVEFLLWVIFSLICSIIELRLMLLAWSYRLENEDDEMRRPPPKYSSCVRGVYSKENINYLPTYEEALKNIQLKKQRYSTDGASGSNITSGSQATLNMSFCGGAAHSLDNCLRGAGQAASTYRAEDAERDLERGLPDADSHQPPQDSATRSARRKPKCSIFTIEQCKIFPCNGSIPVVSTANIDSDTATSSVPSYSPASQPSCSTLDITTNSSSTLQSIATLEAPTQHMTVLHSV